MQMTLLVNMSLFIVVGPGKPLSQIHFHGAVLSLVRLVISRWMIILEMNSQMGTLKHHEFSRPHQQY